MDNDFIDSLSEEEKGEFLAGVEGVRKQIEGKRQATGTQALQAAYDKELAQVMKMNVSGPRRVFHIAELKRKFRGMGLQVY